MRLPRVGLYEDEKVELHIRPHWRIALAPTLWGVVVIGVVIVGWIVFAGDRLGFVVAGLTTTVGVIVFLRRVVRPLIRWWMTDWIVTPHRVLVRYGVIRKERRDYLMTRIEDVALHQRRSDLWLGCGTLILRPADDSPDVVLHCVPSAPAVRIVVVGLIRGHEF